MKPVLVTPPDNELIVSLVEAKEMCREDTDEHDAYITRLIRAATLHLDGYTGILGRALLSQTWEVNLCSWERPYIRLPLSPIDAAAPIEFVHYYDTNNVVQTLPNTNYYVFSDGISPYLRWTSDAYLPPLGKVRENLVTVRFKAGYGTAANVPENIKLIISMLVSHWFNNREPVVRGLVISKLPLHVESLIAPLRLVGF